MKLARPVPAPLQLLTTYEGALMSDGSVPEAARAFIRFLASATRATGGSPPGSSRWTISYTSRITALSCQRRNSKWETREGARKMMMPATDSSSSAANMRGMLSR